MVVKSFVLEIMSSIKERGAWNVLWAGTPCCEMLIDQFVSWGSIPSLMGGSSSSLSLCPSQSVYGRATASSAKCQQALGPAQLQEVLDVTFWFY